MLRLHSMNFETVPFSRLGVRRWGSGGGHTHGIGWTTLRRNDGFVGIVLGGHTSTNALIDTPPKPR